MHNPLEQFSINVIGQPIEILGVNLSFNTSALFVGLSAIAVTLVLLLGLKKISVVPNKAQIIVESLYNFVYNITVENIGIPGKKFVPFMLTLFLLFLFGNLIGLLPFSFAFNSHFAITSFMSIVVLIVGIVYGLYKHKLRFFTIFIPPDIPIYLAPFLIPSEIISFFSKIFSMAVRLFANIMSGHLMLFVISSFIFGLGIFGILPFSFLVLLNGFEIFIAVLHAYIFTVLSCIFIGEIVNLH